MPYSTAPATAAVREDHLGQPPDSRRGGRRVSGTMLAWAPLQDLALEHDLPMEVAEFVPSFDVKETVEGYLFRVDVPGVRERDLEIVVAGNRLTIAGKREEESNRETDTFYTRERSHGTFRRTFSLPDHALLGNAHAELEGGVLTIRIPKRAEGGSDLTRP